ncbi:MAG TPA: lysylphosphatidylglycerol synthase domain-containing protein, partial [Xanthomonadales bacterium]|nr:lysylphosphatidylglycerol synthase domain-containing protein [Xanthomonadales bacterium]
LRWTALAVALVVLGFLAAHAWRSSAIDLRRTDVTVVVAALLASCAANLVIAHLMVTRYRRHGSTVPLRVLLRAFFLGQIAKYVPGKVTGLWFQATTLEETGAGHIAFASNVEVSLLGMASNGSLGLALLLWPRAPLLAAAAALAGAALCLRIGTWRWTAGLAARLARAVRLHVPDADFGARGTRRALLAFHAVNALVMVPATAVFLVATLHVDASTAIVLTGATLVAWVVSVAALVFPAGLGVREAAFVALGHLAGAPIATGDLAAAAVLLRLLQIAQDVLCAALFAAWDRSRERAQRASA